MAVRAPEDKRFRRASVRPAGRRRRSRLGAWLRTVRVALLACAGVGAATLALNAILDAPAFHVRHVLVTGNHHLATGEVGVLLEGVRGQHVLAVDLDLWRQRLLEQPWVADAAFRRVLPATVEVTVVEREPMAIGRLGGRLYLVDERGAVIDDYGPRYADLDLPVVDGLGPDVDPARAALAGRLLGALEADPALAARVSQLNVANPHDAVVILDGDGAQLHLGDARFVERLRSYLELATTLHERVPEIDYVDLRFESRVFVRPVGGALARSDLAPGGPRAELP